MLWLELRHLRTSISRIAFAAGTDIIDEDAAPDRVYQFYVLILVVIAALLSWLGALDVFVGIVATLDGAILDAAPLVSLVMTAFLFVILCFQHLRTLPIRLSYPDISHVASSPVSMSLFAYLAVLKTSLLIGICGIVVGYSLGVIISVGSLYAAQTPFLLAAMSALLFICFDVIASALGLMRLLVKPKRRRFFVFVSLMLALCLVFSLMLLSGTFLPGLFTQTGFIDYVLHGSSCISLATLALIIVGAIALSMVSRHLSTSEVIEDNALYAELFPLRHLQMHDTNSYRVLRRQKLLAMRAPVSSLPNATGSVMLIKRSILSIIRQYEGLSSLAVYALGLIPLGVFLLVHTFNLPVYLFWALTLIALPGGQHELVRVFRDDMRNHMMRDHIPFTATALLFMDSLPALLLTTAISVVVIILLPLGSSMPLAILLAVLLNIAMVTCGGLGSVVFTANAHRISFEFSVLLLLAMLGISASFGSSLLVVSAAAVASLLFLVLLRQGREV